MDITYDNEKLANIIKDLIINAQSNNKSNYDNLISGDADILLKNNYNPDFLNDTNFYKFYDAFDNTLTNAINQKNANMEKNIKYDQIITEYNKLVRFIQSQIKYSGLPSYKQNIIDNVMTNLLENIKAVQSITKKKGSTEMFYYALENIINNISNKDYLTVKVELKKSLEDLKKNIEKYEIKLDALIKDFFRSPSQNIKNKIKDNYLKYSQMYKKIGQLFSKTERDSMLINDPSFNDTIENITGLSRGALTTGIMGLDTIIPDTFSIFDAEKDEEEVGKVDSSEKKFTSEEMRKYSSQAKVIISYIKDILDSKKTLLPRLLNSEILFFNNFLGLGVPRNVNNASYKKDFFTAIMTNPEKNMYLLNYALGNILSEPEIMAGYKILEAFKNIMTLRESKDTGAPTTITSEEIVKTLLDSEDVSVNDLIKWDKILKLGADIKPTQTKKKAVEIFLTPLLNDRADIVFYLNNMATELSKYGVVADVADVADSKLDEAFIEDTTAEGKRKSNKKKKRKISNPVLKYLMKLK